MHLRINAIIASFFLLLPISARERIEGMPTRQEAANQFQAYPVNDDNAPALSRAPKGYEAFHIEHYGRHGSRWLGTDKMYALPVTMLEKAQRAGKLTSKGEELLSKLQNIKKASNKRVGELTPAGHRQHQGIARRMVRNFPEIYSAGNYVNARSTTVIRCILSMAAEVSEIERLVPGINCVFDASMVTQKTLNNTHVDTVAENLTVETNKRIAEEYDRHPYDLTPFTSLIFNDAQWCRDSISSRQLFKLLYDIGCNRYSHDNLYNIDEYLPLPTLIEEWKEKNIEAYVNNGMTPVTNHRPPYAQRFLLNSIIEACDTALVSKQVGANLRFGHETVVLPLAVLMEVGGTNYETAELDSLHHYWRAYQYYPMACNLQFIYYRPKEKKKQTPENVLVKVLLNEKETTLPGAPVAFPYYRWSDLRNYYQNKLNSFKIKFNEQ